MTFTRRQFNKASAIAAMGSALPLSSLQAASAEIPLPPYMPAPKFIDSNGIRMAVYEQGTGPAVVLAHGFPELAFSWRHQIGPLVEAGFHVMAPDLRGYGLTGGPDDPAYYDVQFLCDDLIGMLDTRGIEKAVFCGHDWGGYVVWAMGRLYPERCSGIIGLNTAAERPSELPPVEREGPPPLVRGPNYYADAFRQPGRAEPILEADVRKTLEFVFSRGGIWDREAMYQWPENSPERQMDWLTMIQQEDPPGEPFMPEDVLMYFVKTFEATGFTGGLNWYRANPRNGPVLEGKPFRLDMPCLYIGAENDTILTPERADGMEDFISDLEKYLVLDSGHWTQQEKPEEVNEVLLDWLTRKIT